MQQQYEWPTSLSCATSLLFSTTVDNDIPSPAHQSNKMSRTRRRRQRTSPARTYYSAAASSLFLFFFLLGVTSLSAGASSAHGKKTLSSSNIPFNIASAASTTSRNAPSSNAGISTKSRATFLLASNDERESRAISYSTSASKRADVNAAAAAGQRQQQQQLEYQRRKEQWANRYTSLESLRETFGSNKNILWGDLDAASARKLYKTLLPKALLELVQAGVQPEDLAPLAYQARVAAKLYARERCQLPARWLAALFDGVRTLRKYGRFQPVGMSYEQVWEKYESQVLEDLELLEASEDSDDVQDKNIIAIRQVCLKILESSCRTNSNVDKWVLPPDPSEQKDSEELMQIAQTLENDVQSLLHPVHKDKSKSSSIQRAVSSFWNWFSHLFSSGGHHHQHHSQQQNQ
mmetsp:Transcript_81578/g.236524  ORF Transcript_81578/g.236524 Transcript_81578/m.236524 type:complete len:405 (-) Transcript_81578:51-1265(-)